MGNMKRWRGCRRDVGALLAETGTRRREENRREGWRGKGGEEGE